MKKIYRFIDCVDIVGSSCDEFDGEKRYVSTGAINVDVINEEYVEFVNYKTKPSRANLIVQSGDIIFAKMQGTKKHIYIDENLAKNIYSTGFCAVKAKKNVITDRCLYYLVSSRAFLLKKDENCSGATQKSISNKALEKIYIKIPDINQQEKIADQLDKVNKIIKLCIKQLSKYDELIKARFVEMFENGSYKVEKLGTVCKKITDGTHKTPRYLDNGITFISAKNIVNGELDFTDVKHISEKEYQEIQKRCQTAMYDILLSKSGTLGSPVIVKTEEKLGLFESLAVLKYDRKRLSPEFLYEQLKTDRIQKQFKIGTKGVSIKHLHLGVIANIDIIVPPLNEQKAFSDFVHQVDKSKFNNINNILEGGFYLWK